MPNLTHNDLKEVLIKSKNAVLKQFEKMFKLEDIVLEFTDDAIDCVAKEALEKDIGARGLRPYLKKYCCNYNMNCPLKTPRC